MPDEVQRLVRKLQPVGPRSFDEQSWPMHVAIVVLAGYLLGVVLSFLHFDDPRLFANALTWICVIIATCGIALWSIGLLQNTILRRTLVFSFLASLIINFTLLTVMAWTSIFNSFWNQDEPIAITQKPRPEVIVPEFPLFNHRQEQHVPQEYERPVETGEPEAQKRIELTRQAVEAEIRPNELIPSPTSTNDQPSITKPRRADTPSTPRRSEALAKLSRQPLRADLKISRTPHAPSQPRPSEKTSPPLDAQLANITPQQNHQNIAAPQLTTADDQTPRNIDVAKLARRNDSTTVEARLASLPSLRRRLKSPRALPRTTTPIDAEPTNPKRTRTLELEANSTLMAKRVTSAPETMTSVDLQPDVAMNLARARVTQIDRLESESLSESISRANLSYASPQSAVVNAPAISESSTQTPWTPNVRSSATTVAHQETISPTKSMTNMPGPAENAKLAPAPLAVARVVSETSPSIAKEFADSRSLTRARLVARSSSSSDTNLNMSVEALADSNSPSPATEPSRMALAQSSVGVAGVGDASNLERGVAAPDSPISIASASANRARPTQDLEPGPSLSPSAPSLTRQLRASDESPRTSLQAQPIDTAMVPGATLPAAQTASSSATLERAPSNAPSASATAARGSTEIDLGPTRIAADTGMGRAEGGGQPEITTGDQPRALRRSDSAAGMAELRTDATAPDTASPAAEDVASTVEAASASGAEMSQVQAQPTVTTGGGGDQLTGPEPAEMRISPATGHRAEPTWAEAAPAVAGGGTASPGRQARTLQIQSSTNSETPMVASEAESAGSSQGQPLDAQGLRPTRAAAGLLVISEGDVGAVAGDISVDGTPDNLPAPSFSHRTEFSGDEGRTLPLSESNLGTPKRQPRTSIAGSSTGVELDPEDFAVNVPSIREEDSLEGTTGLVTANDSSLESGGALLVEAEVPDVDGGLGQTPAIDSGIISRQSQIDSELVSLQPARFLRRTRSDATFSTKTNVVSPTKAFRRRVIRKGEQLAGERGLPSPKTEAAIELGLVFLARYQSSDGSWSLNNFADGRTQLPRGEQATIVSDTAATGLSLLSFLGAGYHHRDDKYQQSVKAGIDFLVQHQKADGDLYVDLEANSTRSAWMYSHAIATIALCEAFGMTQDPELQGPAQKAINFIIQSQHPTRGGWRYSPAYGSDTSVTGWMTMAMKSGELAGLRVPKKAYDNIEHWLDLAQVSDRQQYLFRYNPYAPDTDQQRHGRRPTCAMTAVGLLARLYTGWRRDDPNMILGARILSQNPPIIGNSSRPRRDTYYWYYATQVMYHMGGDFWENWNRKLHPLLTKTQITDGPLTGSWNPQAPVPDRWGTHGGRLYVTTMNLLSLEVFYRHLPIYEETSK